MVNGINQTVKMTNVAMQAQSDDNDLIFVDNVYLGWTSLSIPFCWLVGYFYLFEAILAPIHHSLTVILNSPDFLTCYFQL